jgi:hypothetical protein
LPARKSGRRLKKPGAMLQRIMPNEEIPILGKTRPKDAKTTVIQHFMRFSGLFCVTKCPYLTLHLSPILHNRMEKAKNHTKIEKIINL